MAHNHFDFVWKHKIVSRGKEYSALAKILGIPKKVCHFGYFNEDLLQAAAGNGKSTLVQQYSSVTG